MKTKFILLALLLSTTIETKAQVLLNEVYSDPGAGKHEFFEVYNSGTSGSPESMNNYTLVTFFDISGNTGFYVMDLPNLSVTPKGFFVGSSAFPFNYQGVNNSTASDFDWNSEAFVTNGGYVKKWVKRTLNLLDGNLFYDEEILPANFNDFFFRRTGSGASYTVFLYKNGVLINGVIFGTGGSSAVLPVIVAMPSLNVNMSGASPDFTINFSTYGSAPIESVIQDAGSDNGFIRKADGLCGSWDKSSSQVQHTPRQSNGKVDGDDGSIAVSSVIIPGTAATGSTVKYDVVSAPVTSFPVTVEVYTDLGTPSFQLDGQDQFVGSNTETVVTDGPFNTVFTPHYAHVLLVVKASAGCIDKILFVPNAILLPVKLISFNGNMNNGTTRLEWAVASNEQAYKYEIEKSADGKNFEIAGLISPTDRSGNENYTYQDESGSDKIYYRLKITDKSSVVTYSRILSFSKETETKEALNIIGNNVTDKLTLSIQSQKSQAAEINIVNMSGKLIAKQKINVLKGNNVTILSLPSAMNSGMYIANLSAENLNSSAKFIKQ